MYAALFEIIEEERSCEPAKLGYEPNLEASKASSFEADKS